MDNTTTILFECLKSDLGLLSVSNDPLRHIEMKNHLLAATKIPERYQRLSTYNHVLGFTAFDVFNVDKRHEVCTFNDVYQVLSFLGKVKEEPTPQQEEQYVSSLLERERETKTWRKDRVNPDLFRLIRLCSRYAASSLNCSRASIEAECREGPGATYERTVGDDKRDFSRLYRTLHRSLGHDFHYGSMSLLNDSQLGLDRLDDIICRLTLVPKDIRGPRGVFIQPQAVLFAQLGLMGCFNKAFGDHHCLFHQMHNPHSQHPSQDAAVHGSSDGSLSTIDLSDASDRVPLCLIRELFHRHDYVMLASTRPAYLQLLDGSLHKLAMFAPMGAGTCFPVLTWVCCSITLGACMHQDGVLPSNLTPQRALKLAGKYGITVFGDDICVKTHYYEAVVSALQACNLKVNVRKSYGSGPFRESCGFDAIHGTVITPFKLRVHVKNRQTPMELESLISLHNRMVYSSYNRLRRTCEYLRSHIESQRKVTYSPRWEFPNGLWVSNDRRVRQSLLLRNKLRINSDLHRVEYSTWQTRSRTYCEPLCSWWNYNYSLFANANKGFVFADTTSPRRGSPATQEYMHRRFPRLYAMPKYTDQLVSVWSEA